MITQTQFDKRVKALYASQKKMAAPKKWKSGKRAGAVRHPGFTVEFTEAQLHSALMARVGFNAIPCPYCKAPIDILSLTLDHVVPRSIGGRFSLDNMQICCVPCNERKGPFTHEGYSMLLIFGRKSLSPHDYDTLLDRLKAAHSGSANRFFRDRKPEQPNNALPPAERQMQMEDF